MKKAEEGYTIKDLIVQFSRFVKKSRWILTGGVILGIIAGFLLNSREKVYTSEVIIGSTQIPSNTLTEFVNNSKFTSTTKNSCELVVEDIRAISLDESNYESIASFNVIEATIEITNRDKAEDYWSCLLSQLNDMTFISKLHGQNQVLLNEELQAINVQIDKLTKLQNSYQEIVDEQKWNAPIGIFNNSSQTEMLELLKHKKEIKTQLFIDSQLHIISDVRVDPNPINGPVKSYSIGLLGVLFLSIIVSLVAELRRSI
jgi:hypothetical protein